MSITFYCPEAPRTKRPCPFCAEAVERGYDENGRCDAYCTGEEDVSEAPELNLANTNALNLINLLGLRGESDDYYGVLEAAQLPSLHRALVLALNSERRRAHLVTEQYDSHQGNLAAVNSDGSTGRSCRYIVSGNTDAQTVRRLSDLQKLVTYAQQNGLRIVWS